MVVGALAGMAMVWVVVVEGVRVTAGVVVVVMAALVALEVVGQAPQENQVCMEVAAVVVRMVVA
jgi:hypothetical protein